MGFRLDINGLRAIAVLAVVLFHFNAQWLAGGFAGVDVFFVVSGYLMTAIIFTGINRGSFSLLRFYVSRANRIIPALFVLCIFLLASGWFVLGPNGYKALAKHAATSMSFISNFVYWKESGYFAADAHEKWLLHSWSLAVEWQFYILYPILVLIVARFLSIQVMRLLLLTLTLLAFVFALYVSYQMPTAAYFLLPARMWEMMLGGLAFLYPLRIAGIAQRSVYYVGLLLIVSSFFVVSEYDYWPGYMALLPVLGAFLVIQANYSAGFFTSNAIAQSLGRWSYSIYLWHWPIVVGFYYFSVAKQYYVTGIVASVLLGFLSYRYIESIRFKADFSAVKSYVKFVPAYMVLLIGLVSLVVFYTGGARFHYSQQILDITKEEDNKNPRHSECHVYEGIVPECVYGEGPLAAIVIGDSHAQSVIRSVEKAIGSGSSVMDWTISSCPTIRDVVDIRKGYSGSHCGDFVRYALAEIARYPNVPIVVVNRLSAVLLGGGMDLNPDDVRVAKVVPAMNQYEWRNETYRSEMLNAFVDTLCQFSASNPVYLLTQVPEMKVPVPRSMVKDYLIGLRGERVKILRSEYDKRNREFNAAAVRLRDNCNVHLIDVTPTFCDAEYCYGDLDGRPLYYDDDHLSEFGAAQLIPSFQAALGISPASGTSVSELYGETK